MGKGGKGRLVYVAEDGTLVVVEGDEVSIAEASGPRAAPPPTLPGEGSGLVLADGQGEGEREKKEGGDAHESGGRSVTGGFWLASSSSTSRSLITMSRSSSCAVKLRKVLKSASMRMV